MPSAKVGMRFSGGIGVGFPVLGGVVYRAVVVYAGREEIGGTLLRIFGRLDGEHFDG